MILGKERNEVTTTQIPLFLSLSCGTRYCRGISRMLENIMVDRSKVEKPSSIFDSVALGDSEVDAAVESNFIQGQETLKFRQNPRGIA